MLIGPVRRGTVVDGQLNEVAQRGRCRSARPARTGAGQGVRAELEQAQGEDGKAGDEAVRIGHGSGQAEQRDDPPVPCCFPAASASA